MKRPLVLCIMDGYAFTDTVTGNAVKAAKKQHRLLQFSTAAL